MGGRSSSANTTNTTNQTTSGSVGIDGDNQGYVVSGVRGSTINVTDGGSVKAALKAMSDANTNVTSMAKNMVTANTDLSKYSIGQSSAISKQALVTAQAATTDAMDVMKNLSMSSDSGTAQEMTKYFMFGAVAISVAMALKGKI